MASRKAKVRKPVSRLPPPPPEQSSWLEADSYDQRAWQDLSAGASTIAELTAAGERMVPHFGALLKDVFLALFKYNLVFRQSDAVRQSALLNRTVLEHLIGSPLFAALKERTVLEEDKAAIAALALVEQVMELVRGEKLINRREMLDLWDLKHQEDDLKEKFNALKAGEELAAKAQTAPPEQTEPGSGQAQDAELAKKIEQLREASERAAQVAQAQLNQKGRALKQTLEHARVGELKRLQLKSAQLAEQIEQIAHDSHDFGLEFGQAGRLAAGERLELGRRLARNPKIAQLARMVGHLRQDALAIRRKLFQRGAAELYEIERGAELARLIPAELIALHHPLLSRDFHRRLLEGEVLQFQLKRDEEKSKGPMIVCLDLSSSMQGDKELWAKAVTLTLLDLARRQRRLFRAVLFSSGPANLKVLDLNRERRYQPALPKVLELAEYFPGGGTEFERPLDAALELLTQRQLKRADIVIITDGECQVSPQWLATLRERKDALQFKILAVLVDVGSSELSTLTQFADKITSVKQLNDQDTRQIFLQV